MCENYDGVPMDLYKSNLEFWAPLITITINSVCNSKIPSS